MRLLERDNTGGFNLTKDFVGDDKIPPYAILSHTWGADSEEVTFDDLRYGTGKDKLGYEKIRFCGEQARQDGLQYFWIDTCCINKANYTELSEAINSMFRWYRDATRCYVYLLDVSSPAFDTNEEFNPPPWESHFRTSRWFERGWTLQELLAPKKVEFFSRERQRLGDKSSLKQQIHEITGIAGSAILGTVPLSQFSVDDRFSWIERRQTKLEEDKAYSLLGIFDVHMSLIYGEGRESAFKRLRGKIDKSLNGPQRILAFERRSSADSSQRRDSSATTVTSGSETYFPSPPPSPHSGNDPQFKTDVGLASQSNPNAGMRTFCATDTLQKEKLWKAVKAGKELAVEKILSSSNLDTTLKTTLEDATAIFACKFADENVLMFIVKRIGPHRLWNIVDDLGQGLIHNCVNRQSPNERFVKWILKRSPPEAINKKDKEGWTPLRCALSYGKSASDVVKLLLEHNADFSDNPPKGLNELPKYYRNDRRILALMFSQTKAQSRFRR